MKRISITLIVATVLSSMVLAIDLRELLIFLLSINSIDIREDGFSFSFLSDILDYYNFHRFQPKIEFFQLRCSASACACASKRSTNEIHWKSLSLKNLIYSVTSKFLLDKRKMFKINLRATCCTRICGLRSMSRSETKMAHGILGKKVVIKSVRCPSETVDWFFAARLKSY